MYPPVHICRALKRIHPWIRLGWVGEKNLFGLVQLYYVRDAVKSYRDPWLQQGPLFSSSGRPEYHDWDGVFRKPMHIIDIPIEDVYSGKVVRSVQQWLRPIAARVKDSLDKHQQDTKAYFDSVTEGMTEDILFRSRNANHAPIVAKKFIERTPNQQRMDAGLFDRPIGTTLAAPPGGWDRARAKDEGDASDLGSI
jgi:hypothetical protein